MYNNSSIALMKILAVILASYIKSKKRFNFKFILLHRHTNIYFHIRAYIYINKPRLEIKELIQYKCLEIIKARKENKTRCPRVITLQGKS